MGCKMVAGCSPIVPTCSQLHTPPIRGIMSTMATLASPQKITFAEMRESGARGLLVYCADYRCSHSIAVSADRWPDEVQLSDIEPRFTCTSRGNLRRTGCTVPPFTSIAEHRERRMAYESIPDLLVHRDRCTAKVLGRSPGIAEIDRPTSIAEGDAHVESPGGISPPGAPRTVHDPLESHGSRCSAVAMT